MKLVFSIYMMFAVCLCCLGPLKAQQSNTSVRPSITKEHETPPVEVIAVDDRIKVTNAPTGSKLEIYSVVGIKVAEIEIKGSSGEYPVNVAKGYYIVRIGETVRKIAIR